MRVRNDRLGHAWLIQPRARFAYRLVIQFTLPA